MDSVWNEEERRFLDEARRDANKEVHRRQPGTRLLSPFTVSCLVFNRTIGGVPLAKAAKVRSLTYLADNRIWYLRGSLDSF